MKDKLVAIVTDKIIRSLEAGIAPWKKCWASSRSKNLLTGKPYSGSNALFTHPMVTGFKEPGFLTYQQAKKMGGQVKRGSRGIPIIFYSPVESKKTGEVYNLVKRATVFNIEQIDGIKFESVSREVTEDESDIAASEVVNRWEKKPSIDIGPHNPCYRPALDTVYMPMIDSFTGNGEYHAAMFHELVHSTGHTSRLNRDMKPLMLDHHSYSKEELVAEIGAAFLCHHVGIECVFENQVAYCKSWLSHLDGNREILLEAARDAHKAFSMIIGETNVNLRQAK